jgi:hypothetical protein
MVFSPARPGFTSLLRIANIIPFLCRDFNTETRGITTNLGISFPGGLCGKVTTEILFAFRVVWHMGLCYTIL